MVTNTLSMCGEGSFYTLNQYMAHGLFYLGRAWLILMFLREQETSLGFLAFAINLFTNMIVNETSFCCPTSGGIRATMSDNPWFHHIRFIEFEPSSSVVPTYHQDEDDQDAQHLGIQDDNPTITELIHIEYSLDDISKTETPIVIKEDEKIKFKATKKLHKVPTADKSICPKRKRAMTLLRRRFNTK
ncbi:hypothetical protein Tco_0576328 [Tanacetum coccineum]